MEETEVGGRQGSDYTGNKDKDLEDSLVELYKTNDSIAV